MLSKMVYSTVIFLTVLIFQNSEGLPRLDPLVETNVGLIRGLRATDGDYSMFLGIPYALVDLANPFGPSAPHPGFDETFEAYDDSAICPQIEEFDRTIVGTLDCLHLNIYVPDSASSGNRLPVLVWIYGGGFSIGFAGRYVHGPKYLVRHDIILVTLNYRLGPYGFMCLDTPEVPGNQGFKDQLLALRWINENIESFGGDVSKVTLFGESAGSISVDYHLRSEQEKLFNKVIMQSGTALSPGLVSESDTTAPLKLAEILGFETTDFTQALSYLSQVDTNLVIAAASQIDRFLPCVEKDIDNTEKFLSDFAVNQNIPKANGIPILIGANNDEHVATYGAQRPEYFEGLDVFNDRLKAAFDFNDDTLGIMEDIVRHFYIGDEEISEPMKFRIADFGSDIVYLHPTQRSIARFIDDGAENVFFYIFSYTGGRNFVKRRNNITVGGAAHADEIGYLFDISFWTETPEPEDQLIIDRMTTMWANFVKYSNPTPETSELLPVKWEPITRGSSYYYLDIDSELSVKRRPFNGRLAFWDLFYDANWKSQWGYLDNSDE